MTASVSMSCGCKTIYYRSLCGSGLKQPGDAGGDFLSDDWRIFGYV